MTVTTPFARARTEQQRAERRAAILTAAARMLADGTRVPELSLNELARRVGLAKSNVLRYFETREAVLLSLLDEQYGAWLDALETALAASTPLPDAAETDAAAIEAAATALARTAAERPVFAELLASAALVLEHNVSAEIAADYKHRAVAQAVRLVAALEARLGPLPSDDDRIALAGAVNLAIGGAWGMCRPSPGMAAAYERHPELQAMQLDYAIAVRELTATVLTGLRHRAVSQTPLPV